MASSTDLSATRTVGTLQVRVHTTHDEPRPPSLTTPLLPCLQFCSFACFLIGIACVVLQEWVRGAIIAAPLAAPHELTRPPVASSAWRSDLVHWCRGRHRPCHEVRSYARHRPLCHRRPTRWFRAHVPPRTPVDPFAERALTALTLPPRTHRWLRGLYAYTLLAWLTSGVAVLQLAHLATRDPAHVAGWAVWLATALAALPAAVLSSTLHVLKYWHGAPSEFTSPLVEAEAPAAGGWNTLAGVNLTPRPSSGAAASAPRSIWPPPPGAGTASRGLAELEAGRGAEWHNTGLSNADTAVWPPPGRVA